MTSFPRPMLAATAAAVLAAVAFAGGGPAGYHFESAPRTPLAHFGEPSRDPKLAVRASGSVYVLGVFGSRSDSWLGLAVSHDGGDSFAPPARINAPGTKVKSHGENSPTFASGRGRDLHVLWEEERSDGSGTDLKFARSGDFGHNFDEPVIVTDKATPSTNAFSSLAAAPNGDVYAAWLDGRDRGQGKAGTSAIYLAKSSDGGRTFGKNKRLSLDVCPCCRPGFAFGANGEVHVSWRHVFDGSIRDMVVATSTDGGETFGEAVRVAVDNWRIEGCPHSGASMVRKGKRLFVAWYSDGDGSNPGVRLAWSDDGAQSFSAPVIASSGVLDANRPALELALDGRILLVFQGRDPHRKDGWSPSGPWFAEITDSGKLSAPQPVPGHKKSISYPSVAGGSIGRVLVAWTETAENGQQQIHLSRGRPAEALGPEPSSEGR